MSIKTIIHDGKGKGSEARVSSRGQLVVAPLDFSTPYNVKAEVINTAYNLVKPKLGWQFIVTDILLYANKNVGAADATVNLYEATAVDSLTIAKSIIEIEMLKQTSINLTGLNMIVTEGRWINIKTDDDDIFATIMGYYAEAN
jgi:hypothetical protein